MATVLAIANQKGGVGKTTTAIHLAAAFAVAGQRTLLIDLDSQANATFGLGVDEATDDTPGIYAALAGQPVAADWCRRTSVVGLEILPASLELAGLDIELAQDRDAPARLRRVIERLAPSFDWIVIDTPPSLGAAPVSALGVADLVLTPLPPERFAVEGLRRLEHTMARLRRAGRITAPDPLILFTRVQPWLEAHVSLVSQLRAELGERALVASVPFSASMEEATEHRLPAFLDRAGGAAGNAYLYAAAEVMLLRQERIPSPREIEVQVQRMQATIEDRLPAPARSRRPVQPGGAFGPAVANTPASWLSRLFRRREPV
ncbi:MAG: ParA family protein [Minwuia sp.]|uniref:ParA family protein n=1 Tax=Minwuia sp. TaxID=2493630 RepID=UPI003A8A01FE